MYKNISEKYKTEFRIAVNVGTNMVEAYLKGDDISPYIKELKSLDYNVLRLGRFNKYKWLLDVITFMLFDDEWIRTRYGSSKSVSEIKHELIPVCKEIVKW